MAFGTGDYRYELAEGWGQLPNGWSFGWIPAVACDSRDRVFVYSRSEHPLVVFDRDGRFLEEWGAGVLEDAHGIFIDADDNVFCTERNHHCIYKFDSRGELVMTIGTPGQKGARDGEPFNLPTDVGVASNGDLFISDGYGNARVHKYTADGRHLLSWGEWGTGPGQFNLSHAVRVDRHDRVWVCDRSNGPRPDLRHRGQLPQRVGRHPEAGQYPLRPRRRGGVRRRRAARGKRLLDGRRTAQHLGRRASERQTGRVPGLPARHLDRLPRRPLRRPGPSPRPTPEIHPPVAHAVDVQPGRVFRLFPLAPW